MGVEPVEHAAGDVALVLGAREDMAFVLIDDELRFDTHGLEGVPELVGLRRRAFAVGVADHHERWSSYFLEEGDGCTLRVDLGIVVHALAEEWNHPLIDLILAVIALPIHDA